MDVSCSVHDLVLNFCSSVFRPALGQSVVEVKVGDKSASFPAVIRPRQMITSVHWERGTKEVLVRDINGDDLRRQSPLFKERTQMDPDALRSLDMSLVLAYPTLTDSGTYTCLAVKGIIVKVRFSVELRVKGQCVCLSREIRSSRSHGVLSVM
ncbi:hypothetical protein WMY93_002429 [Mugilogobius chulae]|uniref:Ig-like domain-containing protein n=1 Tax=Mugilogobius chulae TaxID=88201 RepID=A0AAW0PVE5_9GOBI